MYFNSMILLIISLSTLLFLSCETYDDDVENALMPDSICTACNNADLATPVLTANGGFGAITSYGDWSEPELLNSSTQCHINDIYPKTHQTH